MKDFKDKVAVITGGASGIGHAIAKRCAAEGMKVVLADVEPDALARAEEELRADGAMVLAEHTDVSKASDVDALARKTLDAFGGVHLLFNNAGVSAGATVWESTLADWEWVLGVNLWGVIHGVRSFVPIMLKQATECHIVNTASIAGLVASAGLGIYKVTKFGVVSLSETLYYELAQQEANIYVSVLCPGWVKTRIEDSQRNRPPALLDDADQMSSQRDAGKARRRQLIEAGMPPEQVADSVFEAIRDRRFYILTHADWNAAIQSRMENILGGRNPQ